MLTFGLNSFCILVFNFQSASTYFSVYQTSHFPAKILLMRVLIDLEAVTQGGKKILTT